jgi:hypothetical protein
LALPLSLVSLSDIAVSFLCAQAVTKTQQRLKRDAVNDASFLQLFLGLTKIRS